MATKLKNLRLTSVDLVRNGANQEADICLFKSADPAEATEQPTERETNILKRFLNWLAENPAEPQEEPTAPVEKADEEEPYLADIYKSAVIESIQSIAADESLSEIEKNDMIAKSMDEYHEAMLELFGFASEDGVTKSDDDDDEEWEWDEEPEEEVEKFNPYHGADGRFASAGGGGKFYATPGKSRAHDLAIERETKRQTATGGGGGKPMTNPTGNREADQKKEWEGADYAVQIMSSGSIGGVDLHSKETDGKGNPWAEGAYGNMKIYANNGDGSQIYMVNSDGYKKAMNAANKTAKERGVTDRKEIAGIFENELKAQSLRTINREYIQQQNQLKRSQTKKSADFEEIEEV